jgi:hypothetical protein
MFWYAVRGCLRFVERAQLAPWQFGSCGDCPVSQSDREIPQDTVEGAVGS